MIDVIFKKDREIKELKKENERLHKKIIELAEKNHYGDGYYKVVAKAQYGKVYSSIDAYGESRVDYTINEWASAPEWLLKSDHHLMCFNVLYEAKLFALNNGGYLFKCEIEERVQLPEFCNYDRLAEGTISQEPFGYYPEGTIAVKRLKLIGKEINYRI